MNAVHLVGAVCLCLLLSCSQSGDPVTLADDTGGPALHGIHAEKLQWTMRELDTQLTSHVRIEIFTGAPQEPDYRRLSSAATGVASTADYIPDAVKDVTMSEEDRRVFLGLAHKLRQEALLLDAGARNKDLEAVRSASRHLTATCNACHTLFRIPIERPKRP